MTWKWGAFLFAIPLKTLRPTIVYFRGHTRTSIFSWASQRKTGTCQGMNQSTGDISWQSIQQLYRYVSLDQSGGLANTISKKQACLGSDLSGLDERMIAPFHPLVRGSRRAESCRITYDFNTCSCCRNMTWIQIRVKLKSKWPMRRKPVFQWSHGVARENAACDDVRLQMLCNNYIQYILYLWSICDRVYH